MKEFNEAIFWPKVRRGLSSECWLWRGTKKWKPPCVYGEWTVWRKGRRVRAYAHRLSYFFTYGHCPPLLRHKCDNGLCVNPHHLLPGTHLENARDRAARGRNGPRAKGSSSPKAKLSESKVSEVFRLYASGLSYRDLGRRFSVSHGTIQGVVRRWTWKHVPAPSAVVSK